MRLIPKSILLVFCLITSIYVNLYGANSNQQPKSSSVEIEAILSKSFEFYKVGLNHKAYNKSMEAYHLLDSTIPTELQGKVYNHVGNFALESELYNDAIVNYNKALEIYDTLDSKRNIAAVYGNLAVVFEYLNKPDLSLEYNFKALDLHIINNDTGGMSTVFTNIGNTYSEIGKYNLCRTYFLKALYLDSVSMDTGKISTDYNNLGYLHSILQDNEVAIKYYTTSLNLDIQVGDAMGQCITYFNIGNVYFDLEKIDASLSNTLKSYSLAKELQSVNYLMKNANLLSEIYTSKKNDKEAYRYYEEFKRWSDTLDLKQKQALLYAKQLENNNLTNIKNEPEEISKEKTTLDHNLWSVFRIVIYLAIGLTAGFLFYKSFILFTNR